jgi:hypothetical protein
MSSTIDSRATAWLMTGWYAVCTPGQGMWRGQTVAVKMLGGLLHSEQAIATFQQEAGLLSWCVSVKRRE